MKLQNWKNDQAGLSLVEMLVALFILVIAFVPLIAMFTDGFAGIVRAGRTSSDLYQAQKLVEEAINAGVGNITPSPPPLRITFADTSNIEIPGVIREVRHNDTTITTFIPRHRN